MPKTKRGIYHNLKQSEYTVSNSEIVFFFSSELYLNKFLDGYENHREEFLNKIEKLATDNPLNMSTLADITLYNAIEKRGFRALIKGIDINWQDLHQYALRKMTERNTLNWQRIPKPNLQERLRIMD